MDDGLKDKRLTMDHGRWTMDKIPPVGGQAQIDDGPWTMDDGQDQKIERLEIPAIKLIGKVRLKKKN